MTEKRSNDSEHCDQWATGQLAFVAGALMGIASSGRVTIDDCEMIENLAAVVIETANLQHPCARELVERVEKRRMGRAAPRAS